MKPSVAIKPGNRTNCESTLREKFILVSLDNGIVVYPGFSRQRNCGFVVLEQPFFILTKASLSLTKEFIVISSL